MAAPVLRQLGRYELLTRLATGGMAEVFLARERGVRGLERLVVVKRILPHLAEQPSFVDMFVREARVIAKLAHPNVVQIHELAEEDGELYIVMEYVPGGSLRELAEASTAPIPVGVAVSLIAQASRGAHAAHELKNDTGGPMGLVHRDISPHNLMVTGEGCVKLLDFGIAKSTTARGGEETDAGTLKGKHTYMSPEQCLHQSLDRRSDVFSLGIVLWELLSAQRLYRRETELGTLRAIVDEDAPDIRSARPEVPPGLAAVLAKALTRNRELRFATADDFRRALLEAAGQAGLDAGEDAVARVVADTLGTRQGARQEQLKNLDDTQVDGPVAKQRKHRVDLLVHDPSLHSGPSFRTRERRLSYILGGAALLGGAVVGALLLTMLFPSSPPRLEGPPLRFGLAPTMDAAVNADEFEPLRIYLERETRRPVVATVGESYDRLAQQLVAGELHFASFPPLLYVLTKARDPRVEVLAFKLYEGSLGTDGVMLVPGTSPVTGLKDLVGKRFCYTDRSSTTGYLMPRAALRAAGVDPDTAPSSVRFTGTHLQLIRDVNAGLCDVGSTYSGAFVSADRAQVPVGTLRVLFVTGRSPQDAMVAGPAASAAERGLVQEALLKFNPQRDVGTPSVGKVLRLSGFAPADDKAYNGLRAILDTHP